MRTLETLENRLLLAAYRLVDLGTLGGGTSAGFDINNHNQVVGSAQTETGATRAFLFKDANGNGAADPGEMTNLGALAGHASSYAYGLNDNGIPVGTSVDSAGNERAVRFLAAGGATDLNLGDGSNARAINDAGEIVGSAMFNVINFTAFHRSASGTVTNLGTLSSGLYGDSEAYGINANGAITGWTSIDVGDRGFVRPPGGNMTPIGFASPPPGLAYAYAWDVNAAGHVVGEGFNAAGEYRAFLYDGTTVKDLGVLPGFNASMALGLNAQGDIVGILEPTAGQNHAFVYQAGAMKDLNDLIPQDSGWVLTEARAINDAGAIVANGVSPTGESRAVLLIPDTTPPTVLSAQFHYLTAPRSLVFRFSEDVSASLGLDDLVVTNLNTNQPVTGLNYHYDSNTNTATFAFPSDPQDANYRSTLLAGGVKDSANLALDGNADGAPGGDFHLDFFFLRGDANHDREVDFADLVALAQNYNSSSGADWSQGDFDGDGAVNFSDLVALAQNYNKSLAPTAAVTSEPLLASALPERKSTPARRPFATRPVIGRPIRPYRLGKLANPRALGFAALGLGFDSL
jgi:probable HAF family extracellular repeat protein